MGHFLQSSKSEKGGSMRSLLRPHRSSSRHTHPQNLTAEAVAALPPPGLSGPSSPVFGPPQPRNQTAASTSNDNHYLAFLSSSMQMASKSRRYPRHAQQNGASSNTTTNTGERELCVLDLNRVDPKDVTRCMFPLLRLPPSRSNSILSPSTSSKSSEKDSGVSLEERLRRERQRLYSSGGATQFTWCRNSATGQLRVLVPLRGNIYIQDGVSDGDSENNNLAPLRLVYDRQVLQESLFGDAMKTSGPIVGRDAGAIDPQLSPDGSMVAFVVAGDIYVLGLDATTTTTAPVRLTFRDEEGDEDNCITHGLADFVAQEEMDRYRGYWWDPSSTGILFTCVDESNVPPYRITHQGRDGSVDEAPYEDHRYPFAGRDNPKVQLGYITVDRNSILSCVQDQEMESFSDMADARSQHDNMSDDNNDPDDSVTAEEEAQRNWARTMWLDPPREAQEYLARVSWLPDGSACAQWQNRAQSALVLVRIDLHTGKTRTLLTERSDVWINLNHMMQPLPRAVHPEECVPVVEKHRFPTPLPPGSFSFFFASERTGYTHLYLYTYAPGCNGERAALVRTISGGEWIVESIVGVDMENDAVYVSGTYGSPLERHLLALPITNRERPDATEEHTHTDVHTDGKNPDAATSGGVRRGLKHVMSALSGKPSSTFRKSSESLSSMESASYHTDGTTRIPDPVRLTAEPGMHNVVMDDECRNFVDTCSDLNRPTTVKVYTIPDTGPFVPIPTTNGGRSKKSSRKHSDANEIRNGYSSIARLLCVLYDASQDDKAMPLLSTIAPDTTGTEWLANLPPPELLSFPTSDGTETLHAAVYKPDAAIHGPGPYPLVCAVYGGPHVQRVNRSWAQSADMRAQLLRSLGFAVVKCDNRGSSRRGLAFECSIRRRLGRLEVLDQVTAVRQLTTRGIADPNRVGIYGWSYGGYLAAMCLCRAPDVFHVAVAGAPVTSWDGYDTHYTERYMGLPSENASGYREAAIFDHVPNMKGKLMIVHGLIDENVHFRHTARLINRLIAAGKDYDLLIFPDERHSPRRLRDRIYMEQRISDYFLRNLMETEGNAAASSSRSSSSNVMRTMPGHL